MIHVTDSRSTPGFADGRALDDGTLVSRLEALVRRERATTLRVLLLLGEIDRRRLYAPLGFASLFDFATRRLGYSAAAAGRRIQAARCIRNHPEVGELLRRNELNFSTIVLVSRILNESNKAGLLARVRNQSQRAVEAIVAAHAPRVRVRDSIRPVRPNSSQRPAPFEDPADINRLFAVRFAASPEFIAKLEQARALLSNRSAKARLVEVLDAALEAFLDRHAPDRRMARREARHRVREARKRRELSPSSMDPIQSSRDRSYHGVVARQRRIPAAARDAVFVRDEGRCTFVGSDGQTCGATHHLHIDHVVPYGVGGAHAIENLRVLCSIHNQLEAARVFGPRRSAGSSDG